MVPLLGILFLIAVFVGISYLIIYSCYHIPNKFGYPKIGKILPYLGGLACIYVAMTIIFEDQLFSRDDARELIGLQGIHLRQDFNLLHNTSGSAPGDYYHKFTLKISKRDKDQIIRQIRSSKQFHSPKDSVPDIFQLTDRYLGKQVTQNFETDHSFVRRTLKPAGEINYAPLYHIITINKSKDELQFEDIVE